MIYRKQIWFSTKISFVSLEICQVKSKGKKYTSLPKTLSVWILFVSLWQSYFWFSSEEKSNL